MSAKRPHRRQFAEPLGDVQMCLGECALRLMSRKQKFLVADQLNDQIRLKPDPGGLPDDVIAARKLFARCIVKVDAWHRRRCREGLVPVSFPAIIYLQPDLSWSDKTLLTDISHLEAGEQGCFKSNEAFAIELAISEEGVKDMVARLKARGFIKVSHLGGKRLLQVTISDGAGQTHPEKMSTNSTERAGQTHPVAEEGRGKPTQKGGANPPAGRGKPPLEAGQTPSYANVNTDSESCLPADTDDRASPKPQRSFKEAPTKTTPVASPPDPQESSSVSLSATGGLTPPSTPSEEPEPEELEDPGAQDQQEIDPETEDPEAGEEDPEEDPGDRKWIEEFDVCLQIVRNEFWKEDRRLTQDEREAAVEFHHNNQKWGPLATMAVISMAWHRVGKRVTNADGSTYGYVHCQNTESLEICLGKKWKGVLQDTDAAQVFGWRDNQLITEIRKVMKAQFIPKGTPEEEGIELEQHIDEVASGLESLVAEFHPKPVRTKATAQACAEKIDDPVEVVCACCGWKLTLSASDRRDGVKCPNSTCGRGVDTPLFREFMREKRRYDDDWNREFGKIRDVAKVQAMLGPEPNFRTFKLNGHSRPEMANAQ